MNVEKVEETDLQLPLIIRDENGNKCVCKSMASSSLSRSTVSHQEMEYEDYVKHQDTDQTSIFSDPQCAESQTLQKADSDYICLGTSDLAAMHVASPKEPLYMYAFNKTFLEPESLGKESCAIKSIQMCSTKESVPYCQASLIHPMSCAAVELMANADIQSELGDAQMEQEDASSSEPFITVINLKDTEGSKCYEVGCVPASSGKTWETFTSAHHAGFPNPDASSNLDMTSIIHVERRVLPTALSLAGDEVANYIDLVSQKSEQHEKQGKQDVEWDKSYCAGSPGMEPFNVYRNSDKKYMHSTPEHEDNRRLADESIVGLHSAAIQSIDEHWEQEFEEDREILTKEHDIIKGGSALPGGQDKAPETIQNDIPKLEKVALPESNCQATFVVFNPTNDECNITSPVTGSHNTTFAVFAVPEEVGGKTNKLRKNDSIAKEQLRRTPLKSNSERAAVKLTSRSTLGATITKARKAEIVSFPKPNFKNIKPKVVSRSALQPKESAALKAAPRSPQLSTASSSSPSPSPRQPSTSVAALRKKPHLDKGMKTETPMSKAHKQHFNKHLPGQVVHAATHSENLSHKVPKAAVLKMNVEQVDRTRCPNSASSPVVLTCSHNSGGMLSDQMEGTESWGQLCALNSCQIAQEEQQQIDFLGTEEERLVQNAADEAFRPAHIPLVSLPKSGTVQGQSLCKDSPVSLKNMEASKIAFRSRKGSESTNVRAAKALSPQRAVQSAKSGVEISSTKGRLGSLSTPGSWSSSGKSAPKSKVPIRGPGLRRTSSISSISSTQSDQSTCSNNSTNATIIIKNGGEWPSKLPFQNGVPGSTSVKPVPRPRVLSLKNTPKGVKSKLNAGTQCTPKSAGFLLPGRKTGDLRGNQRLGTPGQNGSRNVLSTFSSVDAKDKPKRPKTSCIQTCKPVEVQSPGEKQLTENKRKYERQSGIIQRLKACLASSNKKIEAFALVIQHFHSEREEVLKQCKDLSLEIQNCRGELVTTSVTCEKLEKERNELQATYERYVQKLTEQHQSDLSELEDKLKQFYTAEYEKLQNICIEEAEKYKSQLQEQVDNLNITHENFKLELETSHTEKIHELKEEYESSLSELKGTYEVERKTLEESFHEKQEELEKKINELQNEIGCLNEKLNVEEQKWAAKEKANLKNPQIMYLEQELESLKAVLEIKNEQLRQQDSKLLKMENLVENNNTLMEKMRKLQQENEELKARMDRHMELSRQLSTEQQALQESLEKESKVNKRLSMENEELLWKLHNGDLCSPKKLSPGTPPMSFQSRRNSSSFSSPTVSPR